MSDALSARLDDLERRLNEFASELTQLRQAAATAEQSQSEVVPPSTAASPIEVPTVVAAPGLSPMTQFDASLNLARDLFARGEHRRALTGLDRERLQGLRGEHVDALGIVLAVVRKLAAETPSRFETRRANIEYAADQNIRFLTRKLGLREQPNLAQHAMPAATPRPEQRASGPQLPAPSEVARPGFGLPSFDVSDLFGARALALAGGIVTLLGIVFFFVLAVNRGWIGPGARVSLGAAASLVVFLAGLELRRRVGATFSALAAVGAGIAGGYVTLLAAAALYDVISNRMALAPATAIACVGLATSLRWRSQIVAGLGLIGAMLMPVAVAFQGGLSALGTAFAAIVLAATLVVAIRQGWDELLVAALVTSAPQIVALVARDRYHGHPAWEIVVLAASFSLLYLAAGLAYELQSRKARLEQLAISFIAFSGLLAAASAVWLFGDLGVEGLALVVIAGVYTAVGVFFRTRQTTSDVGALTVAIALTIGAVAVADLLSGPMLVVAWSAEAAALAWLAHRIRDVRYQIWSGVYIGLALGHVLLIDAIPTHLFVESDHPARGAAAPLALAIGVAIAAFYVRLPGEEPSDRTSPLGLQQLLQTIRDEQTLIRSIAIWLAGILATYAASLGILGLFASFDWGHVALAGLWSTAGLGILFAGLFRESRQLRVGALVWLAVSTVAVVGHGEKVVATTPRAWSFAVLGAALLVAGIAHQLLQLRLEALDPVSAALVLASVILSVRTIALLLRHSDGRIDREGAALLGLATLYGLISFALFHRPEQRDFTTQFWGLGLAIGLVAAIRLLDDTYLVLALAGAGAALSWLGNKARERRIFIGAAAMIAIAFADAVGIQSPPGRLFVAQHHPASGVPALVCVVVALVVLGWYLTAKELRLARLSSWWVAGLLLVYLLSITLLDIVERVFGTASLHTAFQRGHTSVSAFWGMIGLALLYAGLRRWRRLRLAGLAAFAIGLAKIFLYDLPALSSVTRAASFLAVGAVLLLGGFFYQRLAANLPDDDRPAD
jgi:uncharacterized membrane protein